MKKRQKLILSIIGILIILIGVSASFHSQKNKKDKNPKIVSLAHPERGELVEFVTAPGYIEPKTFVEISAKISARVIELPFDEGDRVTGGDPDADPPVPASVLVRLDDKDMDSRLRSARAGRAAQAAQIEVEKAQIASQAERLKGYEAALRQAAEDLERQRMLLKSLDISQTEFDQSQLKYDDQRAQYESYKHSLMASQLNLEVLEHNLEAADAQVAQAREDLSHTVIRSPIDGIVTRLNAEVGEMVMTGTMNNPGTVILEVADLSRMLVVAEVGEADVGRLQEGQTAEIQVQAYQDIVFTGVVDSIALKHDISSNGTKYYRTEILLDNDPNVSRLYSGLTAQVEIETLRHQNVLSVPSQAILGRKVDDLPLEIREGSERVQKEKTITPVVYRMHAGKALVTPVRIGPSNLTHTVIIEGLSVEDLVVVGPYRVLDGLQHDQSIKDEREQKTNGHDVSSNP